ncbi:MAG: hypothetical protein LBF70_00035, partial [Holosporales bacterium]|nr:hypothetical protein [Holosporales bacterium]
MNKMTRVLSVFSIFSSFCNVSTATQLTGSGLVPPVPHKPGDLVTQETQNINQNKPKVYETPIPSKMVMFVLKEGGKLQRVGSETNEANTSSVSSNPNELSIPSSSSTNSSTLSSNKLSVSITDHGEAQTPTVEDPKIKKSESAPSADNKKLKPAPDTVVHKKSELVPDTATKKSGPVLMSTLSTRVFYIPSMYIPSCYASPSTEKSEEFWILPLPNIPFRSSIIGKLHHYSGIVSLIESQTSQNYKNDCLQFFANMSHYYTNFFDGSSQPTTSEVYIMVTHCSTIGGRDGATVGASFGCYAFEREQHAGVCALRIALYKDHISICVKTNSLVLANQVNSSSKAKKAMAMKLLFFMFPPNMADRLRFEYKHSSSSKPFKVTFGEIVADGVQSKKIHMGWSFKVQPAEIPSDSIVVGLL